MQIYRHAFASCFLALAASAMAAPITNGGFETPPTSPVTPGDWQYAPAATRDSVAVHSGSFAADLNNTTPGSNANVFQQTPFGSITPGTTYTLSYYTQATYGVAAEGQLQVGFMNSGGGYLAGSPTFSPIPASANYVLGTKTLVAPAGASAFFISFNSVTGAVAGSSGRLFVDDVSLTSGNVPEPTTLAALALGGVTILRRRKA